MDSFETVVSAVLHRYGYWSLTSFKVELTKAEKRSIGRYSSPRWELDVVAYGGRKNELLVVECKSFLDSRGVDCKTFAGSNREDKKRFKLFFEPRLRRVVLRRLVAQLVSAGFCRAAPKIVLCLAAGKVYGDEEWLEGHFRKKGWRFFGPTWIRNELEQLRDAGYENSIAAIVAKLLLRKGRRV